MRTHIYNRMTSEEIEEYLASGGNTIFIAIGSTENHGVMPVEAKTIRTEGFAVALAEEFGGVALVNLPYFNPGATITCNATIYTSMDVGYKYLKAICKSLYGQGFRRFFILPAYHGIGQIVDLFCRDFYDETHVHPISISTFSIVPPPRDQSSEGKYNDFFELTLCGAYRIMQLEHTIPIFPDAKEDFCKRKEIEPEIKNLLSEVIKAGSNMCQIYMDASEHNGGFIFKTVEERNEVCLRGEQMIRDGVSRFNMNELMKALDDYQAYTNRVVDRYPRLKNLW